MAHASVAYSIVDVFTDTQFCGNPVAVIHDARGLTPGEMQAIAREFGFSETTFILPPRDDAHAAHVRLFTPLEEIPFAGHPTIGTAFVIARESTAARSGARDVMLFDEAGGDVSVTLIRSAADVVGASIAAPQGLEVLGGVPVERVAACLGLSPASVSVDRVAPCVASVGLPFAFVELTDTGALGDVVPDVAAFRAAAAVGPATVDGFAICAFVVLGQSGDCLRLRSRVLSPLGHPPEDPATGSASGALAALLSANWIGVSQCHITQGVEMARPSEIRVEVSRDPEKITVAGHCVQVGTGVLELSGTRTGI
ncbi:MAG: PhzF family phenazine biosynthesis protein [Pseudomonadota bacterium]